MLSRRFGSGALAGAEPRTEGGAERFPVLGVNVDAVQIPSAIGQMVRWIEARERGRYVAVTGMHGVTEGLGDPATRRALRAADLVVPDGMPLVWLGRLRGHDLRRRVYGPELMLEFMKATASRGYRHFFYGGAPGVADNLASRMSEAFPGLTVAGSWSPPYGPVGDTEMGRIRRMLDEARPDILWVGLSTPKQELWMYENRAHLNACVLVGVGAAFDLNSGRLRQAPGWMRENGLEWIFRLAVEPRRLWKRYLVGGSRFVWNVSLELMNLKRFD